MDVASEYAYAQDEMYNIVLVNIFVSAPETLPRRAAVESGEIKSWVLKSVLPKYSKNYLLKPPIKVNPEV